MPQALSQAKYALGSLAQEHAELERRRRANLAFSGQVGGRAGGRAISILPSISRELPSRHAPHGTNTPAHAHQPLHAHPQPRPQTLVGDSLDVLQDAVESIVAAFLLPSRDLKTLHRYQSKVSGQAGGGV